MKNKLKLLSVSLLLTMTNAYSTDVIEQVGLEKAPRIVANQMKGIDLPNQEKEIILLEKGILAFQANNNDEALLYFQQAALGLGSPLGYLYASILEEDENISNQYFGISYKSCKYEAISYDIFMAHNLYANDLISLQNPKAKAPQRSAL